MQNAARKRKGGPKAALSTFWINRRSDLRLSRLGRRVQGLLDIGIAVINIVEIFNHAVLVRPGRE
jgi:hypothetical protein